MRLSSVLLSFPVLLGCGVETPPLEELRAAQSEALVAGTTVTLQTYLWRDFQPSVGRDPPLLASFRLVSMDGSALPPGIGVDGAFVLNGDEVWTSEPEKEQPSARSDALEVVSRDGPRWATGSQVDVVVRVRGGPAAVLLRTAAQTIQAVE